MASILVPRFPLIKTHFATRPTKFATGTGSTLALPNVSRMESSTAASAAADTARIDQVTESSAADTLIQYVVVRRDLIDTWPLGSLVTQGCHASVAAIWENKYDQDTLRYCSSSNLDSMHKGS
ncbi:hypothetical protein OROMI_020186 [Orobanche minor]